MDLSRFKMISLAIIRSRIIPLVTVFGHSMKLKQMWIFKKGHWNYDQTTYFIINNKKQEFLNKFRVNWLNKFIAGAIEFFNQMILFHSKVIWSPSSLQLPSFQMHSLHYYCFTFIVSFLSHRNLKRSCVANRLRKKVGAFFFLLFRFK